MSTREVTVYYVNDEGETIRIKSLLTDDQIAQIIAITDEGDQ